MAEIAAPSGQALREAASTPLNSSFFIEAPAGAMRTSTNEHVVCYRAEPVWNEDRTSAGNGPVSSSSASIPASIAITKQASDCRGSVGSSLAVWPTASKLPRTTGSGVLQADATGCWQGGPPTHRSSMSSMASFGSRTDCPKKTKISTSGLTSMLPCWGTIVALNVSGTTISKSPHPATNRVARSHTLFMRTSLRAKPT
mgnify:CR=1 FL=1